MTRLAMLSSLVLMAATSAHAQNGWEVIDTGLAVDFNGASIGADSFQVLVGDGGTIVHPGTSDAAVPSGTVADLFDVYAADATTAVAVGRDVALRWDGATWTPIVEETNDQVFTSVWITPEGDFAFFNVPGSFTFRRAIDLATNQQQPLQAVSGFDIAYCGASGDVKSVTQDGSIAHFDNALMPGPGSESTFGVLFDNSQAPLNLTAAWFPPGACSPYAVEPFAAFAIDSNRFFHRFTAESGWSVMPVDGGGIPGNHTLTWLGGSGPDFVIAVGFKPAAMGGGNEGVVWLWDGQLWREDTTLPVGAAGIADLAYRFTYDGTVHADGFEPPAAGAKVGISEGVDVDILAAAESGRRVIHSGELFPETTSRVVVDKRVLDYQPFMDGGGTIVYEIRVTNRGNTAADVGVTDTVTARDAIGGGFEAEIELLMETCQSQDVARFSRSTLSRVYSLMVPPRDSVTCELSVELVAGSEPSVVENEVRIFDRSRTNLLQQVDVAKVETITGY